MFTEGMRKIAMLLIAASVIATSELSSSSCSEEVCGSQVSRCLLEKACDCAITPETMRNKTCSCCEKCVNCLGKFLLHCCSCVGLCRAKNDTEMAWTMRSYVDDFPDNDPTQFEAISSQRVPDSLFSTFRFPKMEEVQEVLRNDSTMAIESLGMDTMLEDESNCTVVYIDMCISLDRCRTYCNEVFSASKVRWFHSGCCECIGHTCLLYGSRTARCRKCSEDLMVPFKSEL